MVHITEHICPKCGNGPQMLWNGWCSDCMAKESLMQRQMHPTNQRLSEEFIQEERE